MHVYGRDNDFDVNGNNYLNLDYNNGAFEMASSSRLYNNNSDSLYDQICSYNNLELAFKKARKRKTTKHYVIQFEKDLEHNLMVLRTELLLHSYRPRPLKTFIIREPKTRRISKSDFRDRVVHHAVCNIIEPIFEKTFIYDSYANRAGKGTRKAIERLVCFKRRISRNNTDTVFVLKADIRHFFDTVDHKILLELVARRIYDKRLIWLIQIILANHKSKQEGKGMPLGNLTSQFFANVYLNDLDYFIKHILMIKYYIRYVDDFIILEKTLEKMREYKIKIHKFLKKSLSIELHPEKTKITILSRGICFLGLRIFPHHKLLKKSNIRKFKIKITWLNHKCYTKNKDVDTIYDYLEGWLDYSRQADTYRLKKRLIQQYCCKYSGELSSKEINSYLSQQYQF